MRYDDPIKIVDQIKHYLSNILFINSDKDKEGILGTKIYLHRLLIQSGIATQEDFYFLNFKDLEDELNKEETFIRSSALNLKGVIRRGAYRVSLHCKDNILTFGRTLFINNLDYDYLNTKDQKNFRWEDQYSTSDYPNEGVSGNEYPNRDLSDGYEYSDWSGYGYELDYDFSDLNF